MNTDWSRVAEFVEKHDIRFYPRSVRQGEGFEVAFAKQDSHGFVVSVSPLPTPEPADAVLLEDVYLYPLDWHNYLALGDLLDLRPSVCTKPRSFGTGDRLGMVTAAHLQALRSHDVFPVLAQQSPRELVRTGRDFRDVILSAVSGVLESGYTGRFGADADHIKHEQQLRQAIEAGYTMYTIDVSDRMRDVTQLTQPEIADKARALSPLSQSIIRDHANMTLRTENGFRYTLQAERLVQSAITFEDAVQQVVRFYEVLKKHLAAFDLEVSIDESARVTTLEDHLYVVEYLQRSDVRLWSLAPRFPGEFQKGIDFVGDLQELEKAFALHAALCQQLKGYRLSLHSGSDKFSIYRLFCEATGGNFHVKTSGTSWLQAVQLIAQTDPTLFTELYRFCLLHLEESKQAYQVSLSAGQLPPMPPSDLGDFLARPSVRQLFHISYGVLLEEAGREIRSLLHAHEQEHYRLVAEHIERHLQALQSVR
ncbi:MAG: tagaturonate epimerase family protein [Firmicutes bacterium]|nr:tagaturonate epimerase family protein [Bacillota bacterium]